MADSENKETEGQDAKSVQNLGFKLKSAREAQDLSLDEIAAELRIGVDLLNALEECRFDELGAQVFGKGYLKQYAARLSLDVAELVADYERTVGHQSVEIPPSQTITLRDDRQIKIWVGAGIALLLMAAILWVWWWLGTDDDAQLVLEEAVVESAPNPQKCRKTGWRLSSRSSLTSTRLLRSTQSLSPSLYLSPRP